MNRTIINFIVDAAAFAAFLCLAATGVLIHYVLPPGSGHFSTLWGMDRHQWGEIHFWIAATLTGMLALHLFLHWRWVVCTIQGRPREGSGVRLALAVVALVALVGLAVSPFFGTVASNDEAPPHKMRSTERPKSATHEITGSTTLREVEQRTGVAASVILKELGLPSDTPTDERLGRLRRKHGFEMEKVREVVEMHTQRQETQGAAP
jgi:hypothetical protein